MHERIAEMRELLERANALDYEYDDWKDDPNRVEQAAIAYAELKQHLAARLKASDSLRFDGPTPWYEAAYNAGIRHAHVAMVARAGSGPNAPKWHSAVHALQNELEYYLRKLESGVVTA